MKIYAAIALTEDKVLHRSHKVIIVVNAASPDDAVSQAETLVKERLRDWAGWTVSDLYLCEEIILHIHAQT
jgi:hypothetical protein